MSHTCPGVAGCCLSVAGWLTEALQASLSAQRSLCAVFLTLLAGNHAVLDTSVNPVTCRKYKMHYRLLRWQLHYENVVNFFANVEI